MLAWGAGFWGLISYWFRLLQDFGLSGYGKCPILREPKFLCGGEIRNSLTLPSVTIIWVYRV